MAVDIPEDLKSKIHRSINEIKDQGDNRAIRWVRPEAVHLTLKFLGEIGQEQASSVSAILDDLAASATPFTIEIRGLGCFPNLKRPRVIWIGLSSVEDQLERLQGLLDQKLENIGFAMEARAFHPHLTIGRARKGLSAAEVHSLSSWVSGATIGKLGTFELSEIVLMRSVLEPSGAVYSVMHTARLP